MSETPKPQDGTPTGHTGQGEKTPQGAAQAADVADLIAAVNRQTAKAVFARHQVPPALQAAFPPAEHLDANGFVDADSLERAIIEAAAEIDELQPRPRRSGPTILDTLRTGWPMRSGAGGPRRTEPITFEGFLKEKTQ